MLGYYPIPECQARALPTVNTPSAPHFQDWVSICIPGRPGTQGPPAPLPACGIDVAVLPGPRLFFFFFVLVYKVALEWVGGVALLVEFLPST